jgi:anti-anti-sigma factor
MATHEAAPVAVRRRDAVAVIDLAGDVNASAEAALERAWAEATAGGPDAVVLNFAGAGYINSTGIALIVGILAKARATGLDVRAYGLSPHYREIFEITRLADFLAITTDEESAVSGAEGGNDA